MKNFNFPENFAKFPDFFLISRISLISSFVAILISLQESICNDDRYQCVAISTLKSSIAILVIVRNHQNTGRDFLKMPGLVVSSKPPCVCIEMSLDFVRIMILNNKHDHSVLSYRAYALLRRTLRIVQCVSHREIFRQTDSDSTQTDASLIRFRELDKETLPTESDNIYYLTNRFL